MTAVLHHREVNDSPGTVGGGQCGGAGWKASCNDFPSSVVMSTCLNEFLLVEFSLCKQSRTVNETPKLVRPESAASCKVTSSIWAPADFGAFEYFVPFPSSDQYPQD